MTLYLFIYVGLFIYLFTLWGYFIYDEGSTLVAAVNDLRSGCDEKGRSTWTHGLK